MSHASTTSAAALLICLTAAAPLSAQEHDHDHERDHAADAGHTHDGLHFTHPLFAESVSPDTKLRLDYSFLDLDADDAHEAEMEAEYAVARHFSIEAGVHFEPEAADLGDTHIIAKFANYALESVGVLLGYGLEFGLPTGTPHGHVEPGGHAHDQEIYHLSPFLNAGWMTGPLELVGWSVFEIPMNQDHQESVGSSLRYNASALYHLNDRLQATLEAFGRRGLSGPDANRFVLDLAPGLRVQPLAGSPLVLAAGAGFPLTDEREHDAHVLVSAFWHF